MDHLAKAKELLTRADNYAHTSWDTAKYEKGLAIAHALVALCERIDAVTGAPTNQEGKAIRTIVKGK